MAVMDKHLVQVCVINAINFFVFLNSKPLVITVENSMQIVILLTVLNHFLINSFVFL